MTASYAINTYTVTFNTEDGNKISDVTVDYGTAWADVNKPDAPAKTGYTFADWTGAPATVTSNVTVTASYTINQYTLTFKDGDQVLKSVTKNYGAAITADDIPADPTKAFYTFSGWGANVPTTMPAENKTFTAQWTAKDAYYVVGSMNNWNVSEAYELTLSNSNNGEYSGSVSLTVGNEIKVVRAVGGDKVNADHYPSTEHPGYNGTTGNYTVDANHAGNVTLYFRPAGNFTDAGWQVFGGYFYIEGDNNITVNVATGDATGSARAVRQDNPGTAATTAPKGMTITVETTPADNYEVDKIELWKTNGSAAEQTLTGNTFTMPDYDVTIKVYFKVITWTFDGFTWTETSTGYTAAANYNGSDGSTKTVAAEIGETVTPATCTAAGYTTYVASVTAAVSLDGTAHTSEPKVVTGPNAAGHNYGAPSWSWNDNHTVATAIFTCTAGDDTQTLKDNAPTEVLVSAATCTADKVVKYRAKVTFNNEEYTTESENVTLPNTATGHSYGAPSWSWNADHTVATATFTCSNCNDRKTVSDNAPVEVQVSAATCTADKVVKYTAKVTFNNEEYTNESGNVTLSGTATGHDWEVSSKEWNADHTSVVVHLVCGNNADHFHDETVTQGITCEITEATSTLPGRELYSVTFTYDGQSFNVTDEVITPALGSSVTVNVKSWNSETDDIVIILMDANTDTEVSRQTVHGNTAAYNFSSIQAGIYKVKISKKNHAEREYTDIVVGATGVVVNAEIRLYGDLNGDGKVTTFDAARANSHAKGVSLLTGYDLAVADVIGSETGGPNGEVTTIDAARINSHARGLSSLWT